MFLQFLKSFQHISCFLGFYKAKITLKNYSLTFRSKYGAADIEKKIDKKVYGALYTISKAAEKKLDVYEEYPSLYRKMYFKYQNKNGCQN